MKKWGDRLKKVEQLAQSFQHNPMTTPYKPRLWLCQPSSVWKLFPRQSLAIGFAKSCKEVRVISLHSLCVKLFYSMSGTNVLTCAFYYSQTVHVFALEKEKSSQGQRIFLVTSYSELWHYYRCVCVCVSGLVGTVMRCSLLLFGKL